MSENEDRINELISLSDYYFGKYLFSLETLKNKVSTLQQEKLIHQAIACGKQEAQLLKAKYPGSSIEDIIARNNLKINYLTSNLDQFNRILLGFFKAPNEITIVSASINVILESVAQVNSFYQQKISNQFIHDIILTHELFHYIEEQKKEVIYTMNLKINSYKIMFFSLKSRIKSLSEIAAMSFAKELLETEVHPLILDYLFLLAIQPKDAEGMYIKLMEMKKMM